MRSRILGALAAACLITWLRAAAPADALSPSTGAPPMTNPEQASVITLPTPTGAGYLALTTGGTVVTNGDASHHGDPAAVLGGRPPSSTFMDLAATPSGAGYWVLSADGAVHAFGDADLRGDARGSVPGTEATSIEATCTGQGYWIEMSSGARLPFGDAGDAAAGCLVWPTWGELHDGFGARRDPIAGGGRQHNGLDIGGRHGDEVWAAAAGTVVSSEWRSGFGLAVEVDHGTGRTTLYAHLSAVLVQPGQHLDTGARLGKVGSTGRATGPHLHFELRLDGEPVDPLPQLPPTPPPAPPA